MKRYYLDSVRPKAENGYELFAITQENIDKLIDESRKRAKHLDSATSQNSGRAKANIAALQNALYNIGAFSDSLNYQDENSYYKAVDGLRGPATNKAIDKARDMGYDVNVDKGTINLSSLRNLKAVLNHKKKHNVNDRSWYFDKKTNTGYRIENGKVVDSFEITTGLNKTSDGYTPLVFTKDGQPLYDRKLNLSSTGAGVYTFRGPYTGYGEKMFMLDEGRGANAVGRKTNQAFHAPASPERAVRIGNGVPADNYISFGCISPRTGLMNTLVQKGNIAAGDSVYIEPILPENYLYEDKDGRIKTHYAAMPSRLTGRNFNEAYDLSNILYNLGY